MQSLTRINDQRIDELEAAIFSAAMDGKSDVFFVDCPLLHEFYPHLYVRSIFMPKTPGGTLITSEVHKTRHPFRVLQGVVYVKIDDGEWERIEAPYKGDTEPGTRRVLFIEENTVWETFHALPFITGEEGDLPEEEKQEIIEKIKDTIIEPYVNKLLGGEVFLNKITNNGHQLHK